MEVTVMRKIVTAIMCVAFVVGVVALAASTTSAKEKETQQQGEEYKYQQSGQPLYMDPSKMTSQGVDDLAPGSDPKAGQADEAAGGGAHRGPPEEVKDEVKVIEGPVHYEKVEE